MPYRKEQFVNGEIYHVIVRAIDDNVIFKDINDHYRGIFSIYEFNNSKQVVIRERREARAKIKKEFSGFSKDSEKDLNEFIETLKEQKVIIRS